MKEYIMGTVEKRFAELIWENEPVNSGKLVKLAHETLQWKKSTTYTVLRKLCQKGIFQNENSIVTSLISKNQYYGRQSKQFVRNTFGGSLPLFLAAFTTEKKLSKQEIEALQKLISENKES